MFCSNCGKEIDESVKFCPYCGICLTNGTSTKTEVKEVIIKQKESHGSLSQGLTAVGVFFFVFILFSIFYSRFAIFNSDIGISSTNYGKSTKLEVTESHSCSTEYGSMAICGVVVNKSNHNIGYAQVEINLYDKNGNLVGSTLANINNLNAGGTWKFEAPFIENNVTSYNIENVIGF